jgi:Fic-DOC domain mobile mystery protein B
MNSDPSNLFGDGHTVLGEDDREGLIPSYVATRGELFEAEQRNISEALLKQAPSTDELLDDAHLRALHGKMLGSVWSWAGKYRTTNTNLGVPFEQIPGAMRALVLDTRTWVDGDIYEPDEIAVMFHHRLVAIHPFPNGNGRLGRIAADYLIMSFGRERFSWGASSYASTEELRSAYLGCLRAADNGDPTDLMRFARS